MSPVGDEQAANDEDDEDGTRLGVVSVIDAKEREGGREKDNLSRCDVS